MVLMFSSKCILVASCAHVNFRGRICDCENNSHSPVEGGACLRIYGLIHLYFPLTVFKIHIIFAAMNSFKLNIWIFAFLKLSV